MRWYLIGYTGERVSGVIVNSRINSPCVLSVTSAPSHYFNLAGLIPRRLRRTVCLWIPRCSAAGLLLLERSLVICHSVIRGKMLVTGWALILR